MFRSRIVCIYKITCLINNRVYIGQTVHYKQRISSHKSTLKQGVHDNKFLQKDYNKYGSSNFKYTILEECSSSELLEKETYWINYYGGINSKSTYNMKDKYNISRELQIVFKRLKQKPISKNTREKLRLCNLGRNNHNYGKVQSKEVNLKRSLALKGRQFTPQHKQKLRQNNKRRGYRKYNELFIQQLRQKYLEFNSYTKTADYFNINKDVCSNLIKYGTTQKKPYVKYNEE